MSELLINIPQKVHTILNTLNTNGYEAYIVGGCVRDSLLKKQPQDWDITTSAKPVEVKALFKKTYDTGIKHGTVTVLIGKESFEVTTYRIDGIYEDNRRPSKVIFTKDVIEDLKRRDFTINAMAYHPKVGLIDPFLGQLDLKKGVITCVGDPEERFNEDALRMLRAVRFSAKLNFDIDMPTQNAIISKSHLIQSVSAERIREELNKLLISKYPNKFIELNKLNILKYIMPEFIDCFGVLQNHQYHIYTVEGHLIKTVMSVEPDLVLRWTMLLHDIGKPLCRITDEKGIDHFYGHAEKSVEISREILNRLKFDNKTKTKILKLIEFHDYRINSNIKSVRNAVNKIGDNLFIDYLKVQKADISAQNLEFYDERIKKIEQIEKLYKEIKIKNQCIDLKGLKLNGYDLIQIGIKEGKKIGEILNKLLEIVIDDPTKNDKEKLLEIVINGLI